MSSPIHMQASGLRVLAQRLRPHHLVKSGATMRQSEAEHLVMMLQDAVETLERVADRGGLDD